MDQGQLGFFNTNDRSDRLRPKRTSRVYCHLSQLRDKLQQLIDSDELIAGETIVDYGCGNKPYASLFQGRFQRYLGADIQGNDDAELVLGSHGELPVTDDSVDCVLSSQVLEHVVDPATYLQEAYRVLKPGRPLILSTHGIWPYHPDPTDFWRWTIDGLRFQITAAGFEIASTKGIFGLESVALQLWQDSTFERLPRPLQALYTWFFQTLILLIERRHPDKLANDASVYIVLARKPAADKNSGTGIARDTQILQ